MENQEIVDRAWELWEAVVTFKELLEEMFQTEFLSMGSEDDCENQIMDAIADELSL
jgi:hypothetical protein